jgi:hypothetical protein
MQYIYGEALANYNTEKVEWCQVYMKRMKEIVQNKFDAISAFTLEYIENHTKFSAEELEKQNNNPKTRKNASNVRPEFAMISADKEIRFSIYGNVAGKHRCTSTWNSEGLHARLQDNSKINSSLSELCGEAMMM